MRDFARGRKPVENTSIGPPPCFSYRFRRSTIRAAKCRPALLNQSGREGRISNRVEGQVRRSTTVQLLTAPAEASTRTDAPTHPRRRRGSPPHGAGWARAIIRRGGVALRVPASARIGGTRPGVIYRVARRSGTRLLRGRGRPRLQPQGPRERLRRRRQPARRRRDAPPCPAWSRFAPGRTSLSRARCCRNHRTRPRYGSFVSGRGKARTRIRQSGSILYPASRDLNHDGQRLLGTEIAVRARDPSAPVKRV